jgi:osmotically inducible lipoprotein OsmB
MNMKAIFALAVVAGVALVPAGAGAQERLRDGAMGAAAGALVGGPVGLVVGGVVGYTAGPEIARGAHPRHRRYYHDERSHDGGSRPSGER